MIRDLHQISFRLMYGLTTVGNKKIFFACQRVFHLIQNLQNTIERRSVAATFDRAKTCDIFSREIFFIEF